MHIFAQQPKIAQEATPVNPMMTSRASLKQSTVVDSTHHLQHTSRYQSIQRLSKNNAGEHQVASNSLASSRFAHDLSQVPVQASQMLTHAAPKNLAALRAYDMEEPTEEDGTRLADQDTGADATSPNVVPQQVVPPLAPPLTVGPTATLPPHIRGSSSPAGMPDRIPPRIDTPATITITGLTTPYRDIILSIDGAGGGNGTATINGAATVDLGASATVQLRGVDQTDVGKGGNLKLVASLGGTRLAASAGFSVSSIPQNWSVTKNALVTGTERGIDVNNNWESDSGNVADLDKAERSEQVQYGVGTGCFAGVTGNNSGYKAANSPPLVDHHAAPVGLLTSTGSIIAEQTFIFKDNRTGAINIPATNSGFRLTRNVTEPTPGSLVITTTKAGTATTANGFSSAAGSGTVTSGAQAV
jgi:hypothetical protein